MIVNQFVVSDRISLDRNAFNSRLLKDERVEFITLDFGGNDRLTYTHPKTPKIALETPNHFRIAAIIRQHIHHHTTVWYSWYISMPA